MTKIKLLLFFCWCLTSTTFLSGQVQATCVDCDTTPPLSLKVQSVAQGVLVPKMTTVERLEIVNPAKGSLIFDTTEDSFWVFNGDSWIIMNSITSTQVIQGPVGPTGPTGPRGPQGIRGPQGRAGASGIQGIQGMQGPGGPQGMTGRRGSKGRTGSVGPTGPQGIQGPRGETGAHGPRGYRGTTGAKGDTGAMGPQGIQGPTGPVGTRGYQGLRGARGPQGHQGPMGLQGFQGLRGSQGARGPQGPRGVQGPQGLSIKGDPGAPGPRGPVGPCCSSFLEDELEELARFKTIFEEQNTIVITQKARLAEMNIRLNNLVEKLDKVSEKPTATAEIQRELNPTSLTPTASLVLDEQATLAQNYPNPFQKTTNIEYYIPSTTEEAIIRITNIDGKQIGEVQLEGSGHGLLRIDANTYSTGTFFYTLMLDGTVSETKKMILRK